MDIRNFEVGTAVVWVDEHGLPRPALLTAIHGTTREHEAVTYYPCVNLVTTTNDSSKTDPYGRQIERHSSVSHRGQHSASGRYWRWPDEDATVVAPTLT